MTLVGKRALVTGGSRGIGRAVAQRLIVEGAQLVITARTEGAAAAAAREIGCVGLVADVTDFASLDRVFAQAGAIDILVNNAGAAESRPFSKLSPDDWNSALAVNLTGAFLATRCALPGMVARKWGRIVNMASTAGLKPYLYTAAYCAAKHGLIGFTRALALETARQGVTVNAICPGFTDTDMAKDAISAIAAQTGRSTAEARSALEKFNPQNRLTDIEEIAAIAVFLCGEHAHGITGQSLIVAGGEVM